MTTSRFLNNVNNVVNVINFTDNFYAKYLVVNNIYVFDSYRVTENGRETIMSYENGVLKSKTVNGVPQSLTYS